MAMTIQLYGFWRSNAAFRVRVALALKKLSFEEIEIDILSGRQFDAEYAEVNAEHVVPTFVHDGHRIFQSLAIMEYLDDLQPEPRLLPADAKERAYARSLALVSAADAHPLVIPRVRKYLGEVLSADAAAIDAWVRHWTVEGLATYERLLSRRPADPFALGTAPTIADICIAGQIVLAELHGLDLAAFPGVAALGKRCFELPAFANAHPFRQPHYLAKKH
ncbi:maleylacetoacetate isomerase [Luteibacter sp. OK325]|uniref:maleylacetoacetate isomerase n=1 Tax=Luteibacter sp. OK325 TaxID=2135670 RepID=UPI000D3AB5B3